MTAGLATQPPTAEATALEQGTPGLRRRMACLVYEALLLFGLLLVPAAIGTLMRAVSGQAHETAMRIVTVAVYGVYFTWFWSRRGQTLPMQTWRITLVTAQGRRLSWRRAWARYAAAYAWVAPAMLLAWANGWHGRQLFWAIGVGIPMYALLALLHPQRQFWHDALCGTRLVSLPRSPK